MSSPKLFFNGFKEGFSSFGLVVTDFINFILLLLVYVVGVGASAIVAKILGKHFLDLRMEKGGSHWKEPEEYEDELEGSFRQY